MTTRESVKGLRSAIRVTQARAQAVSPHAPTLARKWGSLLVTLNNALGAWESYSRYRQGPNRDLWLEDWRVALDSSRYWWKRATSDPCPF
jgi:hypothetical protein